MLAVPLSREQFEAAKKQLLAVHGVELKGDRGTVSSQGVTADYIYNPKIQLLNITVTGKPFLISQAAVEDKILSWFRESINS